MTLKLPVVVYTAEQPVSSIGERMGYMRDWLNHQKIELVDFQPISLGASIAFDTHFRQRRHANLFRAAFG